MKSKTKMRNLNQTINKSINYILISTVIWCIFFVSTTGATLSGLQITLKLSNVQIGVMSSMMLLFLPFQIVGSVVQEKFFGRKNFCNSMILVRYLSFLFIVILLVNWVKIPHQIAIFIFIALFALAQAAAQLQTSPWFTWMSDLVPKKENNNFWNKRASYTQIAVLISSITIGLAIDHFGRENITTYIYVMLIAFVAGMFSLSFQYMATDIKPKLQESDLSLISKIILVWRNKQTKLLISVAFVQSFFVSLSVPFIFIYLSGTLNFSMLKVQILSSISCVSAFLSAYLFRIIGNKYGRKPILIICYFLKFIEFILWGTLFPGSSFVHTVLIFILGGFVNIGIATCQTSLITSVANRRTKSIAVAMFFSVAGLAGFFSSNLSGVVLDFFEATKIIQESPFTGFNALAIIGSIGYISSVFIFVNFKELGSSSTTAVIRILLTNNPIRSVVQAHILSKPVPEKSRILTLNRTTSSILAQELVDNLYNPSSRVRESAVESISKMKTKIDPVIYDDLIEIMSLPSLGIQAEVALALGHQRVEKAISILYQQIYDDDDRSLAFACIHALGLIGGKDVAKKLAELLDNRKFVIMWPLIVETLGEISDYTYAEKMFKVYREEKLWTLKKQELIAIAKVFYSTKRDVVYSIFAKETKEPLSTLEKQAKLAIQRLSNNKYGKKVIIALEKEQYLGSLEYLMMDILKEYCNYEVTSRKDLVIKLGEMITPNGKLKSKFNLADKKDEKIVTILLYLWAEMKYSPSDFNRFTYLAAILLIKRLKKRQL